MIGSKQRSKSLSFAGSGYLLAIAATLLAHGATVALKQDWPTPSFMFFIPAVAIAAWFGGLGPSIMATALSLVLIRINFLGPGWTVAGPTNGPLAVVAFLVVAITIAILMEALRRSRALADSHAEDLTRLNRENERIASLATKLLEVSTSLSEAQSVDEVAEVVLSKGLAVVEAARGVLISVDGGRMKLLGSRGMTVSLDALLSTLTLETDIPLTRAIREGRMVSAESAEEFRQTYAGVHPVFDELADMQTYLATPLIHAGETVGSLALHFREAAAVGASDRTFTLLLAQTAAAALHRARSYDAERERRRNAEMLARAREDVLGVVAHDLRNPLNLIQMTAELMLDEELPHPRRSELLGIAVRAAKEMNRLIEDLLDTVRLQSGRLSLTVEDVSVDDIIRRADETFRPVAERRRLHFETTGHDGITVRADPTRVAQIVGNLLGNAIKFAPEQGWVKLLATPQDREVLFQVTDDGPGIPADNVSHIFDSFWQARKNDRRGVGLGLAIAKTLVEAQGGKIWVDSKVDHGSTFSFSLPAVNVPA
ncbi:MAG: Sensory box histidine kinase, partial [Gemmatimonadales bacterium]|nr:Sensory box histidine kinase [Gemmatimonadales bacterium]